MLETRKTYSANPRPQKGGLRPTKRGDTPLKDVPLKKVKPNGIGRGKNGYPKAFWRNARRGGEETKIELALKKMEKKNSGHAQRILVRRPPIWGRNAKRKKKPLQQKRKYKGEFGEAGCLSLRLPHQT